MVSEIPAKDKGEEPFDAPKRELEAIKAKNWGPYADAVLGEIGQVGSQFDGLGHIGAYVGNEIRYYNGFTQEQVGGAYGLKKLGTHNIKPFFTRGILLGYDHVRKHDKMQDSEHKTRNEQKLYRLPFC